MSTGRRGGSFLVAVLLVIGVGGCGLRPVGDPRRGGSGHGDTSARTYGYGPVRDGSVTYQPDVVLIEGGPKVIRSASADGLTWTVDGDADGVDELAPGRIMYATSRAVGRVVQTRRVGDDLAVTLAPVTLTEVFRHARFVADRELDEASLVYQEVPALPGAVSIPTGERKPADATTPVGSVPGGGAVVPAVWIPDAPGGSGADDRTGGPGPAGSGEPDPGDDVQTLVLDPVRLAPASDGRLPAARERNVTVAVGEWEAQPYRTPGRLGLKIGYAATKDLKVFIDFALNVTNLRVRSDVSITNGVVGKGSTFVLEGIRSISVDVSAGAANGADDNRKVRVEVPVEMNLPVAGEPLVYSTTWKFIITTGLSGRNTTVTATGEWALGGGRLGLVDGTLQKPTLSTVTSIMDSISGVSTGPSGLAFAVEVKVGFGIGVPAAFAGPYAKLVVDLGVANGSALGAPLARCVSATLNVKVGAGFGTTISSTAWAALRELLPSPLRFELENETLWPVHRASQTLPNVPLCVG